jgi:hypothetical protein
VLGRVQRLAHVAQSGGFAAADSSGDDGHVPDAHGVLDALVHAAEAFGDNDLLGADIGAKGFGMQSKKQPVFDCHGQVILSGRLPDFPPLGALRGAGLDLGILVAIAFDPAIDDKIHGVPLTVAFVVQACFDPMHIVFVVKQINAFSDHPRW